MITQYILLGLFFIALIFMFTRLSRWAILLFIPLSYMMYFVVSEELPKQLGYAIDIKFIDRTVKMPVLFGVEGKDNVYVLVITSTKVPRLISMPGTKENRKMIQELARKVGNGESAMIQRAPGDKIGKGSSGRGGPRSDIQDVPLKDQPIETK